MDHSARDAKDLLNFTGSRFKSKEMEHAYRQCSLYQEKMIVVFLISISIAIILFLSVAEVVIDDPDINFLRMSFLRVIFISISITTLFLISTVKDENKFDNLAFTFALTLSVYEILICVGTPYSQVANTVNLFIIICYYITLPNKLMLQSIPCVLLFLSSLFIFDMHTPLEQYTILALYVMANVIGAIFSIKIHKTRRVQYYQREKEVITNARIKAAEKKYRRLIEDIKDTYYLFAYDIDGTLTYLSSSNIDLLEKPLEELIGRNWRDVYDITEEMRKKVEETDARCISERAAQTMEFVIISENREKYILEGQKRPVFDESGRVIAIEGIAKNVTEHKRAEKMLMESIKRYRHVVDNIDVGIGVIQNNKLVFTNRAAMRAANRSENEILEETDPYFFIAPEDKPQIVKNQAYLISGEKKKTVDIVRTISTDDALRWVECTGISVSWNDEPATLNIVKNITQRKNLENELMFINERLNKQNKKLDLAANRDTLTGICNRRSLYEYMDEQWSRAVRKDEECCIIMLDIDHFKNINDTYGHKTGDDVLSGLAKKLEKKCRPYDRLGRWGGEEFMLFLPDTSVENATSIAERLREEVSDIEFDSENEVPIYVTISMGVSSKNVSETIDIDVLINHADTALYNAKENGRNRVCVFEPAKQH